jgi:vacuolar protein sorting-associated protein 33A
MRALAAQVRSIFRADADAQGAPGGASSANSPKRNICVYFVPRRTLICRRVLEEEGVYDSITVGELPLDLVPFEKDVLSLELTGAFRECFLENDRTSLYYVARSLMKLQMLFGVIPRIVGAGRCASRVVDMLLRMRRERGLAGEEEMAQVPPEIDNLVIIDRECDLVTPLCTQLTYEGLVDEVYGINNGFIDVPSEVVTGKKKPISPEEAAKPASEQPETAKPVRVALNNDDRIFAMVRDLNFAVVGPKLNLKAKEIDSYYQTRHNADISQLREFVSQFGSQQAEHGNLVTHTNIFERILQHTKTPSFRSHLDAEQNLLAGADVAAASQYLEDCIGRKEPFTRVLRILCMLSLTAGGLKPAVLEFWKREMLQTYGFEHMFTLDNLQKLGFLSTNTHSSAVGSGVGFLSRGGGSGSGSGGGSGNTLGGGGGASFPQLRKHLDLISEDVDEANPKDISFVYSGYAPLSIRIAEHALRSPAGEFAPPSPTTVGLDGNHGHDDDNGNASDPQSLSAESRAHIVPPAWSRFLPGGALVEELQPLPSGVAPRNTAVGLSAHAQTMSSSSSSGGADVAGDGGASSSSGTMSPVSLVFFVGGTTFTEIAALRWLSANRNATVGDVLIASTKLINGDTLLESVMDDPQTD